MSLSSRLLPHPYPLCWLYSIWAFCFSPSWDPFWSTHLIIIIIILLWLVKLLVMGPHQAHSTLLVCFLLKGRMITVFSSPIRFTALPPRLKEMKSQESAAGSKLVLRCETSSEYSALRFKWFKNGNELNRKNKPQNIKIQKKPG